jgi:hypothetical protein
MNNVAVATSTVAIKSSEPPTRPYTLYDVARASNVEVQSTVTVDVDPVVAWVTAVDAVVSIPLTTLERRYEYVAAARVPPDAEVDTEGAVGAASWAYNTGIFRVSPLAARY